MLFLFSKSGAIFPFCQSFRSMILFFILNIHLALSSKQLRYLQSRGHGVAQASLHVARNGRTLCKRKFLCSWYFYIVAPRVKLNALFTCVDLYWKISILKKCTMPLAAKGKNVVRDLDPKIDLRNIRIRMKRKEVLLSVDNEFLIALVQHWTPSTAQYVSDRPTNN